MWFANTFHQSHSYCYHQCMGGGLAVMPLQLLYNYLHQHTDKYELISYTADTQLQKPNLMFHNFKFSFIWCCIHRWGKISSTAHILSFNLHLTNKSNPSSCTADLFPWSAKKNYLPGHDVHTQILTIKCNKYSTTGTWKWGNVFKHQHPAIIFFPNNSFLHTVLDLALDFKYMCYRRSSLLSPPPNFWPLHQRRYCCFLDEHVYSEDDHLMFFLNFLCITHVFWL